MLQDYLIPAGREDRFNFKDIELYMPRMAKAKTMLVGNKNSSVAICTSWDDPELVLTDEIIEKVALAAPIRSTYGVNILLANLALNPQISKLIFLRGGEFDDTETGSLPRKVINNLWRNGVDKKGKIIGTELSLLPELIEGKGVDVIKEITKSVEIIDWEGKDEKSLAKLAKKIEEFSRKTKVSKRKKYSFPFFKVEEVETLPSEKTAFEIREKTPALGWLRLVDRIIRYGKTATLETKEGTQIRELPNVRVTIEDLQENGFSVPTWLSAIPEVKITPEELEAYYQKFIKPDTYYKEIYPGVKKFIRPPTDKYLYCELLFAFPRPKEIDLAVEYIFSQSGIDGVLKFLQEKFPLDNEKKEKIAGKVMADKKIMKEEKAKILLEIFRPPKNQVAELQKRLKEIGSDTDKVLILWDPNVHSFLYSGRPCWVESSALLRDGKLNFKAVFRSHDIAKGWLKNVYGIYRFVQEYLAKPIEAKIGTITIESESGHMYVADLSWVKKLWKSLVEEKRILPLKVNDPRGNLLISVEGKKVEVALVSPLDGRPLMTFKGQPKEILQKILEKDLLYENSHWVYLGQEMAKVEKCLREKLPYIQDEIAP